MFKITCMKCGKETVYQKSAGYELSEEIDSKNSYPRFHVSYIGDYMEFVCDCEKEPEPVKVD